LKAVSIRLGCGLLVAGAVFLAQTPAHADDTIKLTKPQITAAKKHYGDGDKKYKAGDFAGAEVEFKAANDIKAAPQTERQIGLCEDALGHFQVAVDWYDKFLAHVPDKMASQGDEIKKREGEIKALPGKVHIDSTPPGASVSVDDKAQPTPTPTDIDLPPGAHVIKLTATGRLPTQKSIDVAFASTQSVSATLDPQPTPALAPPPPAPAAEAPPPPAAPPPPPAEPRSMVPAYVTGGLAIVAAGVGTVFGVMTLNDKSSYNSNPTSQTADNGDTHALICDMSFGVALTFGVTSAVLFLTKDEPPPATTSSLTPEQQRAAASKKNRVTISPTPMVSAHSGGAGLLVRF
jgi:hypothetical protein